MRKKKIKIKEFAKVMWIGNNHDERNFKMQILLKWTIIIKMLSNEDISHAVQMFFFEIRLSHLFVMSRNRGFPLTLHHMRH